MKCWRQLSGLLLLTACTRTEPVAQRNLPRAQAASSTNSELWPLFDAEQRRDSAAIAAGALSSRELSVRRSAARALARIADARAAELLRPALADQDPEVCTWAAYGLGYACRGREPLIVRALVARAASLPDAAPGTPLWSPSEAISDALGRCATVEAESTLRAWLRGPPARAEAAALALGRVASRTGKLDAATLVELLDAESRSELHAALYPLSRLSTLNASSAERTRALALHHIEARAVDSEFAVRALARTGPAAAAALGRLLASPELSVGLRAEAARELAQLGSDGQAALWSALDRVAERPPSDAELLSASYAWLSALLDALNDPVLGSTRALHALSELPFGASDAPSLRLRKAHLRCTAAALLAGSNYQSPILLACDSTEASRPRELATLHAIGQDKLRGRRKQAYLQRARSSDARLVETAIGLLAEHSEVPEAYELLSQALTRKSLGVIASAAHVLSRFPERATRGSDAAGEGSKALRPEPSVIQALAAAYAEAGARNSIEVKTVLLDAMGALQALSLKDLANQACRSDNPSLREHAESALHLLGEQSLRCDRFEPAKVTLEQWHAEPPSTITLETDAGELSFRLDPTFAPTAVRRVIDLVRAGFYDGMEIHRVVPGFVAQFGDPGGDGYGGDDRPALRCETSPMPFAVGSVGVALSGRDTGSSQLFVTLGRYPHLDGEYAWLGEAGPGWDRVTAGDRILHARVSASP